MPAAKRILITGATRGLGRAVAILLDGLGHETLLTGRDENELARLQRQLSHAVCEPMDLADPLAARALVRLAVERLGGLDGLVNNAGTIDPIAPLGQADPASWARAIEVNLTSPALLIGEAVAELSRCQGRIVNVSTGAALKPVPGWSAYCASKAGLLHLTSVIAAEYPDIACFSLRPGVIDTAMQTAIRQSRGMREADLQRFQDLHQQGGLEPPEVPGRAAAWLVLHGPLERSGQLIEYTDAEVSAGVAKLFGVAPKQTP
jgi:NAD(P)-dependent dehydrogenase (short-subunit alcohol dehydrogenase family)